MAGKDSTVLHCEDRLHSKISSVRALIDCARILATLERCPDVEGNGALATGGGYINGQVLADECKQLGREKVHAAITCGGSSHGVCAGVPLRFACRTAPRKCYRGGSDKAAMLPVGMPARAVGRHPISRLARKLSRVSRLDDRHVRSN